MAQLTVDILTPAGTMTRNQKGDEIIVPLISGEMGVLPGHENLVGQLGAGVVEIKSASAASQKFFVSHGICKIENDRVLILSTTAESQEKIDLERAKSALNNAQNKLSSIDQLTQEEVFKYQRKLDRAQARIKIAQTK